MVIIEFFLAVLQRSLPPLLIQVQLVNLVAHRAIRQLHSEHLTFLGDKLVYRLVVVILAEGDTISGVANGL